MIRKRFGRMLMAAGVLMLVLAAVLIYINLKEEKQAERLAVEDYGELMSLINQRTDNIITHHESEQRTRLEDRTTLEENDDDHDAESLSGLFLDSNTEMPTETVNGNQYIGALEFPEHELRLPVMNDWNYEKLKIAPCRYTGSIYSKDIVICGHNYSRHFGVLKNLKKGEEIIFTDVNGTRYKYSVITTEILKPTEVERMVSGDWDLTLFTCTNGGKTRVTIRCRLQKITSGSEK